MKARVEALLFTSQAPLRSQEIADLLERSRTDVQRVIKELTADYAARETALGIVKQGAGYVIALRNQYQDVAALLMPPELEPAALKTLSVIAVNQPLAQSRLVELRGSTAYDHVKSLTEKGMIRRRKDGNTYILRTTKLFSTRFRVEDDPARIREAMLLLERRAEAVATGQPGQSASGRAPAGVEFMGQAAPPSSVPDVAPAAEPQPPASGSSEPPSGGGE
ncbi:MAG: SMC-Scp complex subunit ScpB [Candidatus Riflebacteria bacterium]|nr:SMC-Scp complex subunit ScpB [Candidatus Riflebacteria bacterium]